MKKLTNHNIYEVWCEYTAESAYVDHKPSKEDLEEIKRKMGWDGIDQFGIKLRVSKLRPFYGK
jgi:hypothetical protein